MHASMLDISASPPHTLSSGLCEDVTGEALALIHRMGKGDPAAFADLYASWGPILLGIACQMLGDRREANEVLHRTFLEIWKRAGDFDPHQSPPFVWALVLMRGIAVKRLRHHAGNRHTRHAVCLDHVENPKTLSSDDCLRLKSALAQLDPEDRLCLESAVFLDYAHGIGPDSSATLAVKHRLRRALDFLRNPLSRHEL